MASCQSWTDCNTVEWKVTLAWTPSIKTLQHLAAPKLVMWKQRHQLNIYFAYILSSIWLCGWSYLTVKKKKNNNWKIFIPLSQIQHNFFFFPHSIPVENFEDHSAPPSPDEKDSGFFMLRKDSERRATLHHILTEDRDKVVANLMEALTQVGWSN